MDDQYDDLYSGRLTGPRASDGAGSYGPQPIDEDDIAPYRREAYVRSARGESSYDREEEVRSTSQYRRADKTRRNRVEDSRRTHEERPSHQRRSAGAQAAAQESASRTPARRNAEPRGKEEVSYPITYPVAKEPAYEEPKAQNRYADMSAEEAPAPKKRGGAKRVVAIVAAVVVVVVLVGAGVSFAYMNNISENLHSGVDQNLREALVQTDMAKEPFYVLLLGTDQSALRDELGELDGVYRSDSIMLARIDPVNKKVALVSIPRDTKVDLGENGIQKINAARAFGGPALAVETVSKLAGVKISHFAEINFDGFQAIVDALGGVEVNVPIEIDDEDAGGSLPAGLQTLNGEQALVLCRSRASYADIAADPDLMRTANQRTVLSAIAHKLLDSDVANIANTVNAVSEYVTTDLEINDIIGIAQTMKGLDPGTDIYTATLPITSEYIVNDPLVPEGWYGVVEDKEWKDMMKRMDQGLPPSEDVQIDEKTGTVIATTGGDAVDTSTKTATVDVKNGTKRDGLAATAKKQLAEYGFVRVTTGQAATQFKYPKTLIIYDNPGLAYEAGLIVKALGQGEAMQNDGTYLFDTDFLVVIGEDWGGGEASSGSSASAKSA